MARPPKDINDLSQCVKVKDGYTLVWCVECNKWSSVAVMFNATIIKTQMGKSKIIPLGDEGYKFICCYCLVDIEYLLTVHHRKALKDKWL